MKLLMNRHMASHGFDRGSLVLAWVVLAEEMPLFMVVGLFLGVMYTLCLQLALQASRSIEYSGLD